MKSLISLQYARLLQNFQKVQYSTAAYQFKISKPIYYPDRRIEMERINEQQKSELVAESSVKKHLPKEFYYRVLGLHKHATTQEIKAAYYVLAKRFHPDSQNSNNDQKVSKRFQEISNAYHILTDESTRSAYDQLGEVKDEQKFLERVNTKTTGREYKVTTSNILRGFVGLKRPIMDSTPMTPLANDGKQTKNFTICLE